MNAREEIEGLVGFEGRSAGTDGERQAARHLADRLEGMGRDAEMEQVQVRPHWALAHVIHALLAIIGSVVSVSNPTIGTILVAIAVVLTFGDATATFMLTRRLLGWRASQNVVSREDGDKKGALVLVAHYDAARTGSVFSRVVEQRRAAVSGLLRRPIGVFQIYFWSMVVVLLCSALRIAGVAGLALTAVQFLPTVLLIVSIPLLVDVVLSEVVPGANDNASGVATVLRLTDRFGGSLEHFDVWTLFTGAREPFALGMIGFLKAHRGELSKDSAIFLNLDEVGSGTVRYTRREGLAVGVSSHGQLLELCEQIAEDDQGDEDEDDDDEDAGTFGAREIRSRTDSDAYAARYRGYPAITITCRGSMDGTAPEHHRLTDTPDRVDDKALERAYGFCCELIQRIDDNLGIEAEAEGLGEEDGD
jgi:Peptidase family M28